jgi:hypothetical protein
LRFMTIAAGSPECFPGSVARRAAQSHHMSMGANGQLRQTLVQAHCGNAGISSPRPGLSAALCRQEGARRKSLQIETPIVGNHFGQHVEDWLACVSDQVMHVARTFQAHLLHRLVVYANEVTRCRIHLQSPIECERCFNDSRSCSSMSANSAFSIRSTDVEHG